MNEVTAVSTRRTTPWAHTNGPDPRPFSLCRLMDVSALGPLGLADIAELDTDVVETLERVGLTYNQASTFADICGMDPGDIWPDWAETVLEFVIRHEEGRCGRCNRDG